MGLFDRFRKSKAESGWSWRGGTRAGHLFDGSKFSGALFYPSKWRLDAGALRDRSRIAYWESVQARGLLGRLVDNVVGTGLTLESTPIWSLIGGGRSEEERRQLSREIELRFALWAGSTEADAAGKRSLYEIQAFEYLNRLRDGETIVVLRYSGDSSRMSPLSLQFIDPEQVMTPYDGAAVEAAKAAGRRIVDGIEIDAYGKEYAIFVQDPESRKFTRVPVDGRAGRRFVLHPTVSDTLGAVRGTPVLAPMIHELQKITDYTVAEIEAAILNAVMAVWVKPGPDAPASKALAGIQQRTAPSASSTAAAETGGTVQKTFDKPGLIVQTLKAGEELQSFDTKRPNVNFGEFVKHITRHLSASIGIPIEVLEESFNANYSASRASLVLFWTTVEKWRETTAAQFLTPVFEAWFIEEVKAGRINATGFAGASPVVRRAWLKCAWLGHSKPSIDPKKEAEAERLRIEDGATTRERAARLYNGSDYGENVAKLKTENVELAEANASISKATETPASPESEDNDDEQDE